MTEESQKFHVVWIMPGDRETTDSTIHESSDIATAWADDRITEGRSPSRKFRVNEWKKPCLSLSQSCENRARKAAQEAYDVAVVREFLDFAGTEDVLLSDDRQGFTTPKRFDSLLESWLESRSTANQKGPENVS